MGGAAHDPEREGRDRLAERRIVQLAMDQAGVALQEFQPPDEVIIVVTGFAVGFADQDGAGEEDGGCEEEGVEEMG